MVNLSASPGEPNIIGTAVFPNPTIVTVELVSVLYHFLGFYTNSNMSTGSCNVVHFHSK